MNIHKLIAGQVFVGLQTHRAEWDTDEKLLEQALAVADAFCERYDAARPEGTPGKSPAGAAVAAIKAERKKTKGE